MKILYVTSMQDVEHASDLLYNGMVELIGQDNIIDFPYREHFHANEVTGSQFQYWCTTIDKNRDNRKKYDFKDIVQLINDCFFDLMFVSTRAYNTFAELELNTKKIPRTIIINGEDDADTSYNNIIPYLKKYWNYISLFLQRQYRYDLIYEEKVVPYVFSCPTNTLPNFDFKKDKELDVFCVHNSYSHPLREKVMEKIKQIKGLNALVQYGGMAVYEYFQKMNNSKISISISGAGWDTTHYIEVPFLKSMLLAQHPKDALDPREFTKGIIKKTPVVYPNNFKNGYSACFYNTDLSDLEGIIRHWLANEKEREDIVKKGYEHVMNYLTTKKMAEYTLKCLDNNNYWRTLPLD